VGVGMMDLALSGRRGFLAALEMTGRGLEMTAGGSK